MTKIFVGQSSLRINLFLSTDIDMTQISSGIIKYEKPDKTSGAWNTTVSSSDHRIYYDVTDTGILDMKGNWYVWARVRFSDDRIGIGSVDKMLISPEGSAGE